MATEKQKQAARKNLEKARAAGTKKKRNAASSKGNALSTAEKDDLPKKVFAFPAERKEPLNDATHVRNAIARFDQVEDVSDKERAEAWKRIKKAAKKYDVDVEAKSWRDLMKGGANGTGSGSARTKGKNQSKNQSKSTSKGKSKSGTRKGSRAA